ncbi:MAG: hypothetical protein JSR27_05620 [Proteobacteria bacterium]|nr:hypothetical protein [Pseudomonadota bacterium]
MPRLLIGRPDSRQSISPLVGEVGARSAPEEGAASKTPLYSAHPPPEPSPIKGEGLERLAHLPTSANQVGQTLSGTILMDCDPENFQLHQRKIACGSVAGVR